jgi:hypothetical protein
MSFSAAIKDISKRSAYASQMAMTEEATKTSVILPFIRALGFDVFSLDEVIPEFIADVGTKKGEKIDFALKINGQISILVEAKPINMNLGSNQHSQLYRYFAVTDARIALLTNGRDFQFFSDTEQTNKMDRKPFLSFNVQSVDEKTIQELSKFHKDNFSVDGILEAAGRSKNTKDAADFIRAQLNEPSDDFVKIVAKSFYDGAMTKAVIDNLRPAIKGALDEVIKDRISERLNVAFPPLESVEDKHTIREEVEDKPSSEIVTTEDELQAFMIVRAIAVQFMPIERVTMRDSKSYCAILADDNNRKPICRLYFNSKTNYQIGIFDERKEEIRHKISHVSDVYKHSKAIAEAVQTYCEK